MTIQIYNISRRDQGQPRALRIPEVLTASDIDDVLYEFGFEWFGKSVGTQRLVHINDDSIDDYGDAKDVMLQANAELALWDRDQIEWLPVLAGDWVVEPQDDSGDGFIRLSDEAFHDEYQIEESGA